MTIVCGVDGCRAGWFAVFHDLSNSRRWWRVFPSIDAIASCADAPSVIAIDVPIGLSDIGARECDLEARRLIGPRRSSVFPAPIRPVLAASTYREACEMRRHVEEKSLSMQAWAIVPKIREIDDALRSNPALRQVVHEVHPEACFFEMNKKTHLQYSKKRVAGREERLAILRPEFGAALTTALTPRPDGCKSDDVLDAFSAVWTAARISSGAAYSLPSSPARDSCDLSMEIVV